LETKTKICFLESEFFLGRKFFSFFKKTAWCRAGSLNADQETLREAGDQIADWTSRRSSPLPNSKMHERNLRAFSAVVAGVL
jgi:hypothetical protein